MKKIIAVLFSVLFLNSIAHAGVGISLLAGQVSTSGTENEKSGDKGPEKNSKDLLTSFWCEICWKRFQRCVNQILIQFFGINNNDLLTSC